MNKLNTIITSILSSLEADDTLTTLNSEDVPFAMFSKTKEAEQASSDCLAASGIAND